MLKPGSGVYYFSRNTLDGPFVMQEGTILGFDLKPEGSEAEYPPAQIAFLHPERTSYLSGSNWRAAFDRISSVPFGPGSNGRHYYSDPSAAPTPLPSADDLDAAAKDAAAKDATSGEPPAMQDSGDPLLDSETEEEEEEPTKPSNIRRMKSGKSKGK